MEARIILFKAKNIDNGEWVEGTFTYLYENVMPIIVPIAIDTHEDIEGIDSRSIFHIDTNTLCQYKNFVDVKNQKIFENDILKGKTGRTYKVLYNKTNENWCFFTKTDGGLDIKYLVCKEVIQDFELEIIGNIHDKE